jgi:putative PEP-CTERM system TPR-repeat lipoprotein
MTLPTLARIFLLLLSITQIYGASAQEAAIEYYEDAVARYATADYPGAEIQLKNALKADPRHLPSRLFLGQVYVRLNDPASSEKELRLALRLGAARDKVFPTLGNALLLQRKYSEILDVITTVNPNTPEAELVYVFRGRAHLGLNQLDDAWASFERADSVRADGLESLLGKIAVLTARGHSEAAETLVDRALELYPKSEEARYQKGQLRTARGDLESALALYSEIVASNPGSYKARVARAVIYIRQGDNDKALADLQIVHENLPYDLNATLLYARVLSQLGRAEEAKALMVELTELINRVREEVLVTRPELLRTATLLTYNQGDLEQAIVYGRRYLELRPQDLEMAKLLAVLQLGVGDEDAAMELLYTINRQRPDDVQVLSLLGEAHLKKSQYGEASRVLEDAAALAPDSAAIGTQLSLGKFGLGLDQEAERELQRSFSLETADSVSAGFILAQLQLRKGETAEAMVTVNKLLVAQPRNPMLYNFMGAVQLKSGDFVAARAAFETASRLSPGFLGSEYNLALLDMHEARYGDARKRLLRLVEIHPQSTLVLMALADLEIAEGNPDLAIPWLVKATALDSNSSGPGIKLVDLYIRYDEVESAMRQAENLVRLYPKEPEVTEALARAQIATGQAKKAVASLRRAAVQTDSSRGIELIKLADQQVRLADYEGARATLAKARNSDNVVDAVAALIRLELITGSYEAAEQALASLKKLSASVAISELLLGDIRYYQGRYEDALAAYQQSFRASPGTLAAIGVFKAKFLLGQQEAAHMWLANWIVAHPEDAMARRNLARSRLSTGKRAQARADYESLVKDGYARAGDYGFLARIYQLDKDERALATAKLALDLAPTSPRIQDIYGWILVTEGRANEGLPYLREAVSRDSDPYLRYHLASALVEVGRSDEARIELQAILRTRQELPWMASARELLDSLPLPTSE